jgi:acyl-CoA thioester hydrolase
MHGFESKVKRMNNDESTWLPFRVRYSETDQMGTFYNSRALEWFEVARTELLRSMGIPYTQMESRGLMLPLVEAHVQYQGRARYDDLLKMSASVAMAGKAKVRFDITILHADTGLPVAKGYTIHAVTDPAGKPMRPPQWFLALIEPTRGMTNF